MKLHHVLILIILMTACASQTEIRRRSVAPPSRRGIAFVPSGRRESWFGAAAGVMTFIHLRAKLVHTVIRQHSESRLALSQRG